MAGRRARRTSADPVPRKQPVQIRAAATVDAIIEAVERILDREGIDALTTNRIAEVAGVSIGTLYQYFPNKEALVAAVHDRYLNQTLRLCRAVLAAADGVPIAVVAERIGAALVGVAGAQRTIHRWLYDLRSAAGLEEPWRLAFDQLVEDCAVFLAGRSDVRIADPRAAAFAVVHAVEGVVTATAARRPGGDVALEEIAAATVQMVAAYLAGE